MPTIPKAQQLNASSVDIMNTIRANATETYQSYVPIANNTLQSVRDIGQVITQFPFLQNEFLSALVNRIGRVMITSKMYQNPLRFFKKGILEFGETIEDIFTNIVKAHTYDPETAAQKVYEREIPDVKTAFHTMNYQQFYKTTIQNNSLKQAFLSWDGVTELITSIVNALYASANYDEYNVMKYMLADGLLKGVFATVQVPELSNDTIKSIVSKIKATSNNLEFMTTKYNQANVATYTGKDDQYIIINSDFEAEMSVEVLASAFNMDKADFMGHRVLIDSFSNLDTARLDTIFENDPLYTSITKEKLELLDKIPAFIVDRNWFMIFDNLENFTEQYNGEGLYWNYWLHTWKTFSTSPYSNAVAFVNGKPAVTEVTVTPTTITLPKLGGFQFKATVTSENFADQSVTWSLSPDNVATVTPSGYVRLSDRASTNITVTATSKFDTNKKGTATITVTVGD